ncbi:hypothetical protein HMPREF1208_01116 [Staphylococcus sp. HGB0015]|uniref:transposase n=1 Tax=Staphylococcus schleiferi TaxID=1295 RepID=UPI00034E2FD1|nr:transposase [Staphylococcus schleiferi]EPD51150.1 hypothetical protein HMPREF1208_01116 [Staphylococcus sp. HGB0015]UXR55892.1 hypothetical protein MUA46_05140 [Staphylococcus schleiferi]UXR62805.1 hypothetical protein MUA72_05130 [Staphylococcus schleiferi]
MCNDILKDNNIKITKVEEDVVIRGQKSNVIFGTLSYKPMTCPHCYHSNPNRIHKHGKRLSRITFLRFQEIAVYLNLLKQCLNVGFVVGLLLLKQMLLRITVLSQTMFRKLL